MNRDRVLNEKARVPDNPSGPLYDFMPVADRVHVIPIPVDGGASSINVYVLGTRDECILVDAGHDATAESVIRTLEQNGIRPGCVRALVVTHAHQDHYGAAGALADWSGAEIWAHPAAVAPMEDAWGHFQAWSVVATDSWETFLSLQGQPFRVSRLLREADRIECAGLELQVLHTPGHERSAIALFEPTLGIMLAGDLVQGGRESPANWLGLIPDPAGQRRSLMRVRKLNPAILCLTHRSRRVGAAVAEDIDAALHRMDQIDAALVETLQAHSPQPLDTLVRAAFRTVLHRDQPVLPNYAVVTVNAFLLDLARRGCIRQTAALLWAATTV